MVTSAVAPRSYARPGLALGLALLLALFVIAISAGDAPARAKTSTTIVNVPAPAPGDVSVGFVALRSTRGDRAKPPKLKIENAKSLPANVTVYAGVGRARKSTGTYLAPYIIVNRNSASARHAAHSAQVGDLAVGMGFVQFHRALKGQVFNAKNILQSNAPVQQTFLNLCQIRKGDVNFKGAIGYLQGTPVLGFSPQGGLSPVSFKADVKKGDCQSAYTKLKNAPGPGCQPKSGTGAFGPLFAGPVCVAPPQGGVQTGITTTIGTPVVSGGGPY